jgi:hypothetical protein
LFLFVMLITLRGENPLSLCGTLGCGAHMCGCKIESLLDHTI